MTLDTLLATCADHLLAYLHQRAERDLPVVDFVSPEGLMQRFEAAGVPLPVARTGEPGRVDTDPASLVAAVDAVLMSSVRTQHPRFFNQNFAGADPIAVIADWLIATVNTTAATFEAGPVFTLMEREVVAATNARIGFTHPEADGVLGPGGSLNNTLAVSLALYRHDPAIKQDGLYGQPPFALFTSKQSHYSLQKAAALLGLGRTSVTYVACDARGGMRPEALSAAIREARAAGRTPLMINATAGTTVLGAFDPIDALADIAEREGLWLHVDGCHGGSVVFSERHRHLVDGLARADSLAWNPHKMLGVTQQCSLLLVNRSGGLLREAFASHANYLFQKDKNFAELDTGDKTVLCARRPDAVKLWLLWKARGDAGFEARIDRVFALAKHAAERVAELAASDGRFCMAAPTSFTHTCFWWVPEDMRPLDIASATPEQLKRLNGVAPRIKDRMQREGTTLIGYQPLGELPNFFRLLIINPAVETTDIDALLDLIDDYGRATTASAPTD